MANLAVIFHWTFADCAGMTLDELMDWHELAIVRHES
ncbi:GpE family phage tail protein [Moraxella caviae]|nr:GpE family phage tail protein [Moraxella caviae]